MPKVLTYTLFFYQNRRMNNAEKSSVVDMLQMHIPASKIKACLSSSSTRCILTKVSGRLGLLPVRPPPVRPLTRSAPYPFGPLITMLPLACQLLSQRRQSVTRSPPYRGTYSCTIGLLLLH